ncbi:GDSL-type esterase/lipase family protein [Actinomycetota bacterium]
MSTAPTTPASSRRWLAVALIAALIACAAVAWLVARSRDDGPPRVLVVGDSLSHGMPGDYTWRYWAARQLAQEEVPFSYVGPYTGTYDFYADARVDATCPRPSDGTPLAADATGGPYRQAFPKATGSAHAARWGQTLTHALADAPGQVRAAEPDVVVLELGFNDLHYGMSWDVTQDNLEELVGKVRGEAPKADIVLTTVPLVAPASGYEDHRPISRLYNDDLPRLAARISTEDSRVVTADLASGYDSATMTWDQTHPNAAGEQHLAKAMLAALAKVGLGSGGWTLTDPPATDLPLVPPTVTAESGPHGVDLTWDHVPGATAYRIASKQADDPAEPRPLPVGVLDDHFTDRPLPEGARLAYTVTAVRGDAQSGPSAEQQVTVGPTTPLVCPSGSSPAPTNGAPSTPTQ